MTPDSAGGPPDTAAVDGIEAAMTGLRALDTTPTASHVAAFERVHTALTEALAAIDRV